MLYVPFTRCLNGQERYNYERYHFAVAAGIFCVLTHKAQDPTDRNSQYSSLICKSLLHVLFIHTLNRSVPRSSPLTAIKPLSARHIRDKPVGVLGAFSVSMWSQKTRHVSLATIIDRTLFRIAPSSRQIAARAFNKMLLGIARRQPRKAAPPLPWRTRNQSPEVCCKHLY